VIHRYFAIWSGTRVHRAYKRMEGDRAFCGMTLRKGWEWATFRYRAERPKCKRCYS
jgi:hypothetical protein